MNRNIFMSYSCDTYEKIKDTDFPLVTKTNFSQMFCWSDNFINKQNKLQKSNFVMRKKYVLRRCDLIWFVIVTQLLSSENNIYW